MTRGIKLWMIYRVRMRAKWFAFIPVGTHANPSIKLIIVAVQGNQML